MVDSSCVFRNRTLNVSGLFILDALRSAIEYEDRFAEYEYESSTSTSTKKGLEDNFTECMLPFRKQRQSDGASTNSVRFE